MSALAQETIEPNLAHERPARVVWALAWPAVALNSLQTINTLLDRTFIGHLSSASLTAHGGSLTVTFLMFSIGIAIAIGATALVARAFGANEPWEFRKASRQALSLTIALGVILSLATAFGSGVLASFILPRSDVDAIHQMALFVTIYAIGMPGIYVIQTLAGALRGVGDTKSPMVISGIQILLHVTLNYLLIFPPHTLLGIHLPGAGMGLAGAATALTTSTWIATIAYMAWLPRTPLGSLWRIEMPDLHWAWRILRISIPAGVMAVLRVLSLMTFTLILGLVPSGSAAIAAMSIAFGIEGIMFMPSFGLGAAAGALVGQSLGMERPDRAERLGWIAAHHAALVTLALAGPIYIAAPQIVSALVANKPDIAYEATTLLRYLCLTEVLFAYSVVLLNAMQGAGDTKRPLAITVFSLWGLRVPLALFMAVAAGDRLLLGLTMPVGLGLGAVGGWLAMSGSQAIAGLLTIAAYRRGDWKTAKV